MNHVEPESNFPRDTYLPAPMGQLPNAGNEPPVDLGTLEALGFIQDPSEPDLIAELIGLFLDDSMSQLGRIEAGAAAHDAIAVRQAAHSLKGSSSSLGANQIAAWCRELEMIDEKANWTGVPILVSNLRAACTVACEFLAVERDRRS
jgi:HPt (histidine-containing phosphotransfer) domain-containing protein